MNTNRHKPEGNPKSEALNPKQYLNSNDPEISSRILRDA